MSKPVTTIPPQLVADLSKARVLGAASQIKAANYGKGDPTVQKRLLNRFITQTDKIASRRESVRKLLVQTVLNPAQA